MMRRPHSWEVHLAPRRRPLAVQIVLTPLGLAARIINAAVLGPAINLQMHAFGRLATFAKSCRNDD